MNAVRFVLPLLGAALAMPSLAQQLDLGVLVVQHGPGDLVLNAPLLDAIANEPQCVDAVRKALGDNAGSLAGVATQLPAPHPAGTFQVHIVARLVCTEQQRDVIVDAIVAHMRQRLDQMLFAQPAEQCKKRRDELTGHLADLLTRRAEMQARIDAATIAGSEVAQRRSALEQQLVGARLDLATQQRAHEQLEKLRAQYADLREQVRAEEQRLSVDHKQNRQRYELIEVKMRDLAEPAKADPTKAEEVKRLRVVYDDISAALTAASQQTDIVHEKANDVQRMLTVILEQMPTNMLDLQRAHARLDALAAEQKQLQELAAAAARARTDAAHFDTQAERVAIEISVTKTMLIEIEGKLARLQPVRYELLRRHQ